MKTQMLYSVLIGLIFCLSDVTLGLWPFSFLAIGLLIYQINSLHSDKKFFIAGLITFLFFFTIRLVVLRGVFTGLNGLYSNEFQAFTVFFFIIFSTTILYSLMGPVLLIVRSKSPRLMQIPLTCLVFLGFDTIHWSIFPERLEILTFKDPLLIASLGVFGDFGYKIVFYFLAVLIGEILINPKSVRKFASIYLLLFITVVTSGAINQHSKKLKFEKNFALIQTNQGKDRIILDLSTIANDLNQVYSKDSETVEILFPEYAFEESELERLQNFQMRLHFPHRLHVGLSRKKPEGLENLILSFDRNAHLINEYEKNILFPIGEKNFDFPLIPPSWQTPTLFVKNSTQTSFITDHQDIILHPLICYEAALSDVFIARSDLAGKKSQIFMNFSKDSYFENSSLLPLFSLFVQSRAVIHKSPIVRVSTNSGTQAINMYGKIVADLKSNEFGILTVKVPIYE